MAGEPPAGRLIVIGNVIDARNCEIDADALRSAFESGTGLERELVAQSHTHRLCLTAAEVAQLATNGRLNVLSGWAFGHAHPVLLRPGDGRAIHDVEIGNLTVAKVSVKDPDEF